MTEQTKGTERPAWLDDTSIAPPYPIMRCPRCKALFSDHGIHICADKNIQREGQA